MRFAGKKTQDEFYAWLNPKLPHDEVYNRSRLLAEYVEVEEKTYWYFLEMLPPMYFTNSGFAICEATTDDIRLGFFRLNGRHFAAHISDHDKAHTMKATRAAIQSAQVVS